MNEELAQRLDELERRVTALDQSNAVPVIQFETGVFGLFQTVSAVPASVPKTPYEQVVIYVSGTTYRLYVYDAVNNVWHYTTLT